MRKLITGTLKYATQIKEFVLLISVVVTAYNRKEFIKEAIESVFNQTLDKEFYEICVVKNFSDAEIDGWLEEKKIGNVVSGEKSLGGKIGEVLDHINGEVVCLLEDDDLFRPEKLQSVYDAFMNYENLGFYHDIFVEVDENGNEVKRKFYGHPPKPVFIDSEDTFFKLAYDLDLISAMGMNSSISIKKDALETIRTLLKGITQRVDNMLFFAAVSKGYSALVDTKKLTYYRVHNSASHIYHLPYADFTRNMIQVLQENKESYTKVMEFVKGKRMKDFCNYRIHKFQVSLDIIGGGDVSGTKFSDYLIFLALNIRIFRHPFSKFTALNVMRSIVAFLNKFMHKSLHRVFFYALQSRNAI